MGQITKRISSFNTQPPEGGWAEREEKERIRYVVSTHSRPKAAGFLKKREARLGEVSTHSRPKAAG